MIRAFAALLLLASGVSAQNQTVFSVTGDSPISNIGYVVENIGDVDGDGFQDVAIGASKTMELVSGRTGLRLVAFQVPISGALKIFETVGDLNGDGCVDLAVINQGLGLLPVVCLLVSGQWLKWVVNPTGVEPPMSLLNVACRPLGCEAVAVSDYDGDGLQDLGIIGAKGAKRIDVFSAATGQILATLPIAVPGSSLLLRHMADIDADGLGELLVSGGGDLFNAGSVALVSGASGAVLWSVDASLVPPSLFPGAGFGEASAVLDDIDGDGILDVAIGAPFVPFTSGSVSIRSGATGTEIYDVTGTVAGDAFGSAIEAIGDIDGDQVSDFAVGAPGFSGLAPGGFGGYVSVFSGADGAPIDSFSNNEPIDGFGSALAAGVDINGDGETNLIVGAPDANSMSSIGDVFVFSYSPLGLSGSLQSVALDPTSQVELECDAGPDFAGAIYLIQGSAQPSIPVGLGTVASLQFGGRYTLMLETHSAGSPIQNSLGVLDANGQAQATFRPLFAGNLLPPSMIGRTLSHQLLAFNGVDSFVSNIFPITVVP